MVMFDPSAQGGGEYDDGVRGGDYLLVLLPNFKRKVGQKSKAPYLRCSYKIIHGPEKGATFWDSMSLNMTSSGARQRLALFADQVDSGPFDLDDDDDIKRALCNRPFKARVNRTQDGKYINNGIVRYLNSEITEFETRIMETWLIQATEAAQFGDGADSGPFDDHGMPDDNAHPGGFGGQYDDDIPF